MLKQKHKRKTQTLAHTEPISWLTRLCALVLVLLLGIILVACGDTAATSEAETAAEQAATMPRPSEPPETEPQMPTPLPADDELASDAEDAQPEGNSVVTDGNEPAAATIIVEPPRDDEANTTNDLEREALPTATATVEPNSNATDPTRPEQVTEQPVAPAFDPYPTETESETFGSELLFLRNSVLVAYDIDSGAERQIITDVTAFAATPDSTLLAVVRSVEDEPSDIWLLNRDGSNTRQLTNTPQTENSLSWEPDGDTLVYAATNSATSRPLNWFDWAAWCANSEVRLLDSATGQETRLAAGCDPVFSNNGSRIAFATPPEAIAPGTEGRGNATEINAIRLVNRAGENGWNFATAEGQQSETGHLVYAPAWSPDNTELAYQRFMGYMALADMNLTEMGNSFEGDGAILGQGAGWRLRPQFAPSGNLIAVVEHNFSDARGWTGYEQWSVTILQPGTQGEALLPTGSYTTEAVALTTLSQATAATWAPNSDQLAVLLPDGWQPPVAEFQSAPLYPHTNPGTLWLWQTDGSLAELPVSGVDFASPLLWLSAS